MARVGAVIRTKEGLIRAICADGKTRLLTDEEYAVELKRKRAKKLLKVDVHENDSEGR